MHLRAGLNFGDVFFCPVLATGASIPQFLNGKHLGINPGHDLYWGNIECTFRFGRVRK